MKQWALRGLTATLLIGLLGAANLQAFELEDGDTFVFLGDSITQAGTSPHGYITLFELFCGVNGYEVEIVNAGISGHKSNDMLARLEEDVLSHNPDWVSISCGVNDVWHQFAFDSEGVPLEAYRENMTAIVEQCLEDDVDVVLLTATPIYEDLESRENQMLAEYNAFLRELAGQHDDVVLCDVNQAFQEELAKKRRDDRLLTTDGVHLNGRGNRIMARSIIRALDPRPFEVRRANLRWELAGNMCRSQ